MLVGEAPQRVDERVDSHQRDERLGEGGGEEEEEEVVKTQ